VPVIPVRGPRLLGLDVIQELLHQLFDRDPRDRLQHAAVLVAFDQQLAELLFGQLLTGPLRVCCEDEFSGRTLTAAGLRHPPTTALVHGGFARHGRSPGTRWNLSGKRHFGAAGGLEDLAVRPGPRPPSGNGTGKGTRPVFRVPQTTKPRLETTVSPGFASIGLRGFEPPTSWSRTKRSIQAELQPVGKLRSS
jgi:hypothetical protein